MKSYYWLLCFGSLEWMEWCNFDCPQFCRSINKKCEVISGWFHCPYFFFVFLLEKWFLHFCPSRKVVRKNNISTSTVEIKWNRISQYTVLIMIPGKLMRWKRHPPRDMLTLIKDSIWHKSLNSVPSAVGVDKMSECENVEAILKYRCYKQALFWSKIAVQKNEGGLNTWLWGIITIRKI